MQHYELARIYLDKLKGDFEGPKPEELINVAEDALGVKFPPSYRQFLREYGCGDVNGVEIYGVIDNEFEDGGIPDAIWFTLEQRMGIGVDPQYILIGEQGDGSMYAIDTGVLSDNDGENPVVMISVDGVPGDVVAKSFGEYLLNQLQ